jgi:hypothetical protein
VDVDQLSLKYAAQRYSDTWPAWFLRLIAAPPLELAA